MKTIYARDGHDVRLGDQSMVWHWHAADRIRIGQSVAIIDQWPHGDCVARGKALEVFDNSYLIEVEPLPLKRKIHRNITLRP